MHLPIFEPALPDADATHLRRAVELGRRGWGGVHPNPMVGCVLVKDGRVVGEGWHERWGGAHAEVRALQAAGPLAEGSTAYVSLEPCRHEGKTPACTGALAGAGVVRVVYGAADPGAESGGGGAALRASGVEVSGPHLRAEDAARENPAFHHRFRDDRAWVGLKLALSLDGAVNEAGETRTRLTGPETAREVHRLRSGFDAVLIGSGTARIDDPLLTVREVEAPRGQPRRIVLDTGARLATDARLVHSIVEADAPLLVFCAEDADEGDVERLEAAGARVHPVRRAPDGRLDLDHVLRECRLLGIESILCEGGAELARTLVDEGRVGRFWAFVAPRTLGADAVRPFDVAADWTPIAAPRAFGADVGLVLEPA